MMTSHENQEYDFRLEEYVSRAVGQNSLTPYGEQNSLTNDLNFRLSGDQVLLLKPRPILCITALYSDERPLFEVPIFRPY